jgi:hypothetical protein
MTRPNRPKTSLGLIFALTFALFIFPSAQADWLDYKPLERPESPRGVVWNPVISFILPGFGQFQEGQTAAGLTYTALGLTGVGLALNATELWIFSKKN